MRHLNECIQLQSDLAAQQVRVAARIQELQDQAGGLGEVIKNLDGTIRSMRLSEAVAYCKSQGTRLPTAREFALYAQVLGAQGISDTPKEGYVLVRRGSDSAGKSDIFYYSSKGYPDLPGDLNRFFWSSSANPSSKLVFLFAGDFLEAMPDLEDSSTAVRCVRLAFTGDSNLWIL